MSLQQYFMDLARSTGGLHVPAGPGSALAETSAYRGVMARMERRQMNAARIRSQGIVGQKFDAARMDADAIARAIEWAEYLAENVERGSNAKAQLANGAAFASSYRVDHKNSATAGWRKDAVIPMASQGLSYILPEVYEYQHPELPFWDGKILKTWTGADPASNEVVWYEMDNVGVARAASTYDVTTIPMVNGPIASDNKLLVVPALVGFETNFMDMRRAAMAERQGKPDFQIEVMKRRACERTLAEFFDNLWFGGDKVLGIDGLMNNPYVETIPITGGAWSGKTALQILDDLKTMAWAIANGSQGALRDLGKVRIILPPNQYQDLLQPITAAGSASILEYFESFFKGEGKGVPKVDFEYRFAAANSYAYNGGPNILSRDTAVIIYEDGDRLADPKFVLTQPIEVPAPVKTTGVGDVTYFHARGSGLMLADARRLKYVTGL